MGERRMRTIAFVACMALSVLAPIAAPAQVLDVPLTPREQTTMLAGGASQSVWSRLYPAGAGAATVTPPFQQDYGARYLSASPGDRVAIAQTIGEEGVERYAAMQRLKMLLGPQGRSTPIGPDSVYWNRTSGKVRILEAKGGSSALKWTHGSLQGTNANTIRSARGVLASKGASAAEKLQAARVIKAAQRGHLETAVVRTLHVLGTPQAPRQVSRVHTENVAKEARVIERDLVKRNPELRAVFRKAGLQHRVDWLAYRGARWTPGRGLDAPRGFGSAPTLHAGFQRLPGTASATGLALAGGSGLQRLWQVGNRWILPVGLGLAGATITTTYYQFSTGSISDREFLFDSAGPAVLVVFTAAGAVIGGAASFGFGAMPGAMIGATFALPAQLVLQRFNDQQYREFNQVQQEVVNKAVEELYLGNAVL